MSKRNNLIIFGVSGVAFILFVIFVYLPYAKKQDNLNKVKESYQHSSYLKDPVGQLPVFSCIDQNGKVFTNDSLKGDVVVANFFYTTCEGYCPTTTKHLATVQSSLNKNIPFHIISFSLNPANDTVAALRKYADMYKADDNVWRFLHGDQEEIYQLGEQGLMTIVKDTAGNFESHSDRFVLMDKMGKIRGFYRGTDSLELQALIQDINYLVFKGETNE
ncbi:MAG TPA: SCO family protein [Chitinophagales bacterium]|nr:SCO family protein [Chitinophagales bacterium]HMU68577.1 SCO family protein [Chitinophagales bacterium]HMX05180.1 SCO family protein [Chitinophagales bacterium]HMZ88738.1 SCO family protein [Chitinophagales bacterium]HNA57862.1 SCO family protein [Chitinophagales bacterium]